MPSAIKHDHELSSQGLVSVLVHRQSATREQVQAFLYKTFPDNDCFVATDGYVPTPASKGLPHAALIGVDGTLLWDGHPLGEPKKVEELVTAELAKVKKGWGKSTEAKKVRAALYGKGDLFAATGLVAAMPEGEERAELQKELDARYAMKKRQVEDLQKLGRWSDAADAAKALLKAVGTKAEWVAEVQPLVAGFDGADAKNELAIEKKLEKIEKAIREKKGDAAPKQLEALLKTAQGTKVGERAQRMLTALKTEVK